MYDIERDARVTAPAGLVWEEVGDLRAIMAKTPLATGYDVAADGKTAAYTSQLAWGPVKWTISALAELLEVRAGEFLAFRLMAPSMQLDYRVELDVVVLGAEVTKLTYRGHLECHHRLASRMRGMLADLVDDHAQSLLSGAKTRAEQRHQARARLQ